MNRTLSLAFALALTAGCGTSTKEEVTRDSMPEVGNYGPPPAGHTPVRAAVMEFQDKTGQRVGEQAGEQFETLAHRSKRFNLIDRMQLKTLLKEQGLEGIVDPAELAKPGKIRGVGYMFLGTITNYRAMTERTKTGGGILDSALGKVAPLNIDTSKTVINVEVGVDIKLVNTTTGEIVAKDFGEVKQSLTAKAWGVRVLGIGGDAKNNVQLDKDSHGKILRWALDESYKKMLPDIDDKLSRPAANVCPKCKTEIAANGKFCEKCGTGAETAKCSCGQKLGQDAKFCVGCGKKVETPK